MHRGWTKPDAGFTETKPSDCAILKIADSCHRTCPTTEALSPRSARPSKCACNSFLVIELSSLSAKAARMWSSTICSVVNRVDAFQTLLLVARYSSST
ncbi:MAG TPA: hypothetical protein PLK67_09080, partial [Bryobacteraceae bacterium]|nr:hypothetical protein [Bryobacteraceae bacterium]